MDIRGPGVLSGRYSHNGGLRALGWIVTLVALAGSATLLTFGILTHDPWTMDASTAFLASGSVLAGLGISLGLSWIFRGDGAVVEFIPQGAMLP